MDLQTKLKLIKPRENAGSSSSNRFDYQKNWAICKLVELSQTSSDFLVAFEYHDDIVIFDSSTKPTQIDFYQIKTKNKGSFNLKALLKKTPTKTTVGNSFLGKLLMNKLNFDKETSSLNIVSNAQYKLKVVNKARICCNELEKSEIDELELSLTAELTCTWMQAFLDIMFLETSDLTIDHHTAITKEKLNALFEKKFSTDVKYNPSLAYRTIFDEVNRKNNVEKKLWTFEELVKYKSISKIEFEDILLRIAKEPTNLTTIKNQIFDKLDNAGIKISERRKLHNSWKDVEIEYLKIDNKFFSKCVKFISNLIDNNLDVLDNDNLIDALENIYEKAIHDSMLKNQKIYNEQFIKLVILKEIYG
jgi:hypothetical protein